MPWAELFSCYVHRPCGTLGLSGSCTLFLMELSLMELCNVGDSIALRVTYSPMESGILWFLGMAP